MRYRLLVILLILQTALFAQSKREMRAAWIATVANIDWPSVEAVGQTEMQKQEMLSILDRLQQLHFNSVIFQIRPTADAFYYSDIEPLSSWLTGKQGQDNDTPYDPLQFVIQEAHQRCIDVHVWLNPYRMSHTFTIQELDSLHIYHQHPEWFWQYGDKWYFDPGLDATRLWLNQVVADIVSRYDIDAIHFDDYFYPYRIGKKDFPDDNTFLAHPRGYTDKNDWRRHNVDMVIEELQQTIKSIKPWVEFGISPFGVWRNQSSDPRGSKTQAGVQNYDDLYADILLWLDKGWIDYVAPQLYWEIGKKVADYEILAHWWAGNSYGRNLYIGHYVSQLENRKAPAAWKQPNEICRQLTLNKQIPQIDGSILYSAAPLLRNPQGILDSLQHDYYKYIALPPINRNLHCSLCFSPRRVWLYGHTVQWEKAYTPQMVRYYVIYGFPYGEPIDFDNPKYILGLSASDRFEVDEPDRYQVICVTAVNQYKNESLPCILEN